MRLISYKCSEGSGLAVKRPDGSYCGFTSLNGQYPGSLRALLDGGTEKLLAGRNVLLTAPPLNLDEIEFLPPLVNARKIICIGLNYLEHSAGSTRNRSVYVWQLALLGINTRRQQEALAVSFAACISGGHVPI